MILLGISGILLFGVSAGALALPQNIQQATFRATWGSLTLRQKMDIQDSLNCCGFNDPDRNVVDGGQDDCDYGHPLCNTTALLDVSQLSHT